MFKDRAKNRKYDTYSFLIYPFVFTVNFNKTCINCILYDETNTDDTFRINSSNPRDVLMYCPDIPDEAVIEIPAESRSRAYYRNDQTNETTFRPAVYNMTLGKKTDILEAFNMQSEELSYVYFQNGQQVVPESPYTFNFLKEHVEEEDPELLELLLIPETEIVQFNSEFHIKIDYASNLVRDIDIYNYVKNHFTS